MNNKRQFIFRTAAIILILILAAIMFIIGRGHTIYFDNKSAEYEGKKYNAYYKVAVIKDKEKVAKLSDDERGMTDLMGQTLSMTLEITDEKGQEPHSHKVNMPIPYGIDGVVINIPELMAGLPQQAYMSEFVPMTTEEEDTDEEVVTDEFVMTEDM
ncbi:MAG: hypothetical protein J5367_01825 [Lachnospiraceae bacterium]|nr:hypothetical protein [Lachnospiraceae bacterium]